jgi:hypothetical protein
MLYKIIAGILAVVVLGMALLEILCKDKTFSEQENRMLTTFPSFTVESVRSETYMDNMESYVADQFPGRDAWITVKTYTDLLLGKREFNGVYLGKSKYLMEIPSEPDTENVEKNIEAINTFTSEHGDLLVNMLIAPNAAYVMEDYLPKGVDVRDQSEDAQWLQEDLSGLVGYIDVYPTLKAHEDDGIYYKTDHHWTSRGAMYAFIAAASMLGIENPIDRYEEYTVTESFSGTLASSTGYHGVKDSIEVYAPVGTEVDYLVTDSDNAEKRVSLYDTEALEEKDKYQVFFGGNHALVDITTTNDTDRSLLIFKDSYANSFVPFLLPYYSEIIMIDPRYYYDNVERVIENYDITDVLFLYNMDTFMTDNSLADVLVSDADSEA